MAGSAGVLGYRDWPDLLRREVREMAKKVECRFTRDEMNLLWVLLKLEIEQAEKHRAEAAWEIELTKAAGKEVRPFDEEYLRYKEADLELAERTMSHFIELNAQMRGGCCD